MMITPSTSHGLPQQQAKSDKKRRRPYDTSEMPFRRDLLQSFIYKGPEKHSEDKQQDPAQPNHLRHQLQPPKDWPKIPFGTNYCGGHQGIGRGTNGWREKDRVVDQTDQHQ